MYERLVQRAVEGSNKSLLLLGPRQVGKTTLLRSVGADLIIDLSDQAAFRRYVREPEVLAHEIAAQRRSHAGVFTVLIDEVQKVPQLLDQVQHVLDGAGPDVRFLLTGSSARKLRRGMANLLPGRLHLHYLHPLLAREIGPDFEISRALAHGTLPAIYSEADDNTRRRTLESYADVYLREEVQAEALVRDLGGYARMIDLVAAASGSILNLHSLSKNAQIPYETARRYLEVLEDTLLVFRVPAWSGSDRASLVSHPRIFFFDVGVRNALLRRPLDRPLDDERGLLLEHLVAGEIHRRIHNLWYGPKLYHYRSRADSEVDFVLEWNRELWGIEVKSTQNVTTAMFRGLNALANRTRRLERRIVLYTGTTAQRQGDIEILPVMQFLNGLPVE